MFNIVYTCLFYLTFCHGILFLSYYSENLKIVREIKDRTSEGRTCGSLGNAYYLMENGDEASKFHNQVLICYFSHIFVIYRYVECWCRYVSRTTSSPWYICTGVFIYGVFYEAWPMFQHR